MNIYYILLVIAFLFGYKSFAAELNLEDNAKPSIGLLTSPKDMEARGSAFDLVKPRIKESAPVDLLSLEDKESAAKEMIRKQSLEHISKENVIKYCNSSNPYEISFGYYVLRKALQNPKCAWGELWVSDMLSRSYKKEDRILAFQTLKAISLNGAHPASLLASVILRETRKKIKTPS